MPGTDNTTTTTPATTGTEPVSWDTFVAGLDEPSKALVAEQIKAASHKANQEAQSLRGRSKQAESVLEKLKARFEVPELTDDFLDQLQRLPTEKLGSDEKAKQLERKLKEREAEFGNISKELETLRRSSAEKARDEQVLSALGKLGVRPDALEAARKLAALDAAQGEDGAWTFGGKELGAYLADFSAAHSYLLANPVAPGPSTRAQVGKPGATLDLAHFASQPKEWQRAHVDEYLAAMKAKKGS